MPSEIWILIALVGVGFQIYGAIELGRGYRMLRDIERRLTEMDEGGTPPTPVQKLPRLSRRQPEPEPGGTKVYPNAKEAWDEGLERTDV